MAKEAKLFEVSVNGEIYYVKAITKAKAKAHFYDNITVREIGAVEATGIKFEDILDATGE